MGRRATAAALGLIAALVAGAPATGETAGKRAPSACPDNSVCVWTKPLYKGKREIVDKRGMNKLSKELNNKVTSVKNNRATTIYLVDDTHGISDYQCVGSGLVFPDLDFPDFNNRTSGVSLPRPNAPELPC